MESHTHERRIDDLLQRSVSIHAEKTMRPRAQPQPAVAVLQNAHAASISRCTFCPYRLKTLAGLVEPIEPGTSLARVGPYLVVYADAKGTDVATILWKRILPKRMCPLVIPEHTLPLCADPEIAVAVIHNLVYSRRDAGKKRRKLLCTCIEIAQPTIRAHQQPIAKGVKGGDKGIGAAQGIIIIGDLVAVVAAQSVVGAHEDEAVSVLQQRAHSVGPQSLLHRQTAVGQFHCRLRTARRRHNTSWRRHPA